MQNPTEFWRNRFFYFTPIVQGLSGYTQCLRQLGFLRTKVHSLRTKISQGRFVSSGYGPNQIVPSIQFEGRLVLVFMNAQIRSDKGYQISAFSNFFERQLFHIFFFSIANAVRWISGKDRLSRSRIIRN